MRLIAEAIAHPLRSGLRLNPHLPRATKQAAPNRATRSKWVLLKTPPHGYSGATLPKPGSICGKSASCAYVGR